ncbi:MAG: sugar transferase [Flavobacteriales bacterium]|nr:sugar transferase [Flavobacteriales bacterium]
MLKRLLDILFSLVGLLVLSPILILISILIFIKDGSPIFFMQERIGKDSNPFQLFKFRTMRPNSESEGQLSIGGRDPRVTDIGHILRKSKVDELPQLLNVLKGDMSLVGPRPEVPRYVALYNERQREVLKVRPGLTDKASLAYFNESELMEDKEDPESFYIEELMPAKLELNLEYLNGRTLITDIRLIIKTISRIFD